MIILAILVLTILIVWGVVSIVARHKVSSKEDAYYEEQKAYMAPVTPADALQELASPSLLPPEREIDWHEVDKAVGRAEKAFRDRLDGMSSDVAAWEGNENAQILAISIDPERMKQQREQWRELAIEAGRRSLANDNMIRSFIDPPYPGRDDPSVHEGRTLIETVDLPPLSDEEQVNLSERVDLTLEVPPEDVSDYDKKDLVSD